MSATSLESAARALMEAIRSKGLIYDDEAPVNHLCLALAALEPGSRLCPVCAEKTDAGECMNPLCSAFVDDPLDPAQMLEPADETCGHRWDTVCLNCRMPLEKWAGEQCAGNTAQPGALAQALRDVLRRLEWAHLLVHDRETGHQVWGCAICGNSQLQPHAPDCDLAAALYGDAPRTPGGER